HPRVRRENGDRPIFPKIGLSPFSPKIASGTAFGLLAALCQCRENESSREPKEEASMEIIGSFGPNPRALRMFLAEKGMEIPTKELDILAGENRKPPYTDKNPGAQLPALVLDDGTVIGETVAIFEYLDETNPKNPLVGSNAKERAEA